MIFTSNSEQLLRDLRMHRCKYQVFNNEVAEVTTLALSSNDGISFSYYHMLFCYASKKIYLQSELITVVQPITLAGTFNVAISHLKLLRNYHNRQRNFQKTNISPKVSLKSKHGSIFH